MYEPAVKNEPSVVVTTAVRAFSFGPGKTPASVFGVAVELLDPAAI